MIAKILLGICFIILLVVCVLIMVLVPLSIIGDSNRYVGERQFDNLYNACDFALALQTRWDLTYPEQSAYININNNKVSYILCTKENQTFIYGERQGFNYAGFIVAYILFGVSAIWIIWAFYNYVIKNKLKSNSNTSSEV